MKRFTILLTIVLTCLTLLATSAEARRFGGGGSIGKQRTMSAPPAKAPAPAAAPAPGTPAQPAATPQPAGNRWLGPLAGLAIGAGLGAMFAGGGMGGMGGAIGSILMIVLAGVAIMFVISMFRRKQEPAMQYAGSGAPYAGSQEPVQAMSSSVAAPVASANIPADFPVESFLRNSKTSFIRLQAANDRKDLNDIREYTTPEMYAEVSMQLQERGDAPQKTDVISVAAELLEVNNENDFAIASVRLSGQLRENNGTPENFDEIWHVQKNLKDEKSVWLLAGIQQIQA